MTWWQVGFLAMVIPWATWVSKAIIDMRRVNAEILSWIRGKEKECKRNVEWMGQLDHGMKKLIDTTSETHGCVKALMERLKP